MAKTKSYSDLTIDPIVSTRKKLNLSGGKIKDIDKSESVTDW
tara:strand:- start:406 stop:531 length:126 start_codon:yes stop_codon:yes gene_type:complete